MSKLESTQYDAALAVSGAWRGTSTDKVPEELGWETLAHRRWYRRLCQFYKIINYNFPEYLRTHLPKRRGNPYNLRRPDIFSEVRAETNVFQTASIHIVTRPGIISIQPYNLFQLFLSLKRLETPEKKNLFGINDIAGARLLTRLRVDFSDLRLHKFDHRFNCDSPTCTCGRGIVSVGHFFLHCQFYADQRRGEESAH